MTSARLELWERRLGQAAALLGQRLDDPPSLAELASAAAVLILPRFGGHPC